ncbi:protein of unknown function, partial [Taphrina deformans PYCC 5710]
MIDTVPNEIESTLESLTLAEKVSLLAGKDFWRTQEIEAKGIATVKTTDGPSGARGGQFLHGCKAAFFPSGVSMAATFDVDALYSCGRAIGQEALSKQASVLLAPTTCIHRSPLGGRNFESYSEDPFLSGKLAASFINGVQTENVAATIKHYVANEQETTRFTVDEKIDERALREIYLSPFEIAVKESKPWCLMTSYNMINGAHADCNNFTLNQVLRDEWQYDGVVMSDWGGTNSVVESVLATLDLEMPGPTQKRGDLLVQKAQQQPELQAAINDSVRRLLTLISRVGKWRDFTAEKSEKAAQRDDHTRIIRQAAVDGIVLLKNDNTTLPIPESTRSILVIGPNADAEVAGGGGSANLNPYYMTTPLASVKERFKNSEVKYELGCTSFKNTEILSVDRGCQSASGEPGVDVVFYKDKSLDEIVEAKVQPSTWLFAVDGIPKVLLGTKCAASISTTFTPDKSGEYTFGLSSIGSSMCKLDGNELMKVKADAVRSELMMTMASVEIAQTVTLEAGTPYKLEVVTFSADSANPDSPMPHNEAFSRAPGVRLGCTFNHDSDSLIASAVQAARFADYVVAVVGLNNEWESEGHDMQDTQMELPGLQNRLISEVAKVNKKIVVCNQSGVALAMPWVNEVGAIMQCWYQGMEMGNAIADILSGDANPSGKLPVSFPRALKDTPCYSNFGHKHMVAYEEGIYVGYRFYDTKNVEPLFAFGHGLSYSSFRYYDLSLSGDVLEKDHTITVS